MDRALGSFPHDGFALRAGEANHLEYRDQPAREAYGKFLRGEVIELTLCLGPFGGLCKCPFGARILIFGRLQKCLKLGL